MTFKNKKVLLFDLDGTLIDSVPDLAVAVNAMLTTLGRTPFGEDTIRFWVGNGAQVLVQRALSGSTQIDETIDESYLKEALEIFLTLYADKLCHITVPYAGVETTLQSLKAKGYRLAIVTNKPFAFVAPILEHLGLEEMFEFTLGGDSLEKKKPDPLPLLHVCTALGVDVEECVMIGDSKNDILAANAASMQSIGVRYGYNYGEDITVYKPDVVCDSFAEILTNF